MKFYAALLAVLMVGIAVGQKKPFECDHSKLQSCASQANDDYGPGRRGLVGELTPEVARQIQDAERIDVPAIQETRTFDMVRGIDLASCANLGGKLEKNSQMCQRQESYWTCAEKSRILEHDESTPAKYWCRKPQP